MYLCIPWTREVRLAVPPMRSNSVAELLLCGFGHRHRQRDHDLYPLVYVKNKAGATLLRECTPERTSRGVYLVLRESEGEGGRGAYQWGQSNGHS